MESNIVKIVKRIAIFAIIVMVIDLIFYSQSISLQGQYLENLNYDITLNEDGSMDIIETWDIYISKTNTLFRDFSLSSKFGEITNVKVKDLETGRDLTEIYEEMYHVTDNCYYGLEISGNKFEIAWGTGMESKRGNKKYQISYTVTDVISDYKDCQELYWMILDDSNGIPAKQVTGTITLPESVSNISNLKVWGHGPLNGEITIESENCVKFEVDGLKAGKMLEVRIATSEKIFNITESGKINNYSYLATIESEETRWAEDANSTATEFYEKVELVFIIVYCVILIYQIIRIIQYYKLYKKNENEFKKSNLKYYRDIPREKEATPGEASYLYYFNKILSMTKQSDVVAGTILDLALKKEILLRCDDSTVYVKIIGDGKGLKRDEKAIYKLLKTVGVDKEEFDINDLNIYAKINYTGYSNAMNKLVNSSRESLYDEGLVDKKEAAFYEKSMKAENSYWGLSRISLLVIVFYVITAIIPLFRHVYELSVSINFVYSVLKIILICAPIVISILIKNKLLSKMRNKIAVLTSKGYEEREQWKALARYMEDFSMLDEKEVPSLVVWEKYLVYATTFGIAEKVIKQMKAKYPEVFIEEYWKDEEIQNYPVLNFALYNETHFITNLSPMSSIRDNVESARRISASEIRRHSSSSGSGGGGGFSSGGGGRRRRRPEWAEDSSTVQTTKCHKIIVEAGSMKNLGKGRSKKNGRKEKNCYRR